MNRAKLKTYAPQARRDFIQAVTDRAALYGLTKDKIEPITEQGDVAIIAGKAFPRSVAEKRRRLEERIEGHGFEQIMEAIAYTWFNRLVAIRFMEIHGYLDHGYRVLSHPDPAKTTPEILEHAENITLPGLDNKKVIDLKLDGTKESELYRMLLIAQCNALHKAMPFLFERIADETELLLPNNLLHSDSLIRKLVGEIDEQDWQQVEIIGWLYQFYISDKKAQVIGKVVKSEDIPAATQLFTPNWIVKYLVQNSLGRQWLATYPDSPLRAGMEFYVEPAEQTPEVQAQLKAITPNSLNPEELTLMDPACGSGHILVEAYDLLKEIYLERGYRLRDIPGLILTKNLFGLEIDDRAAQLAAFALMMRARADDRRIFDGDVQPNVLAIQESNGLNVNSILQAFTEKRITGDEGLVAGEFRFMGAMRAPLFATENRTTATLDEKLAADLKAVFALFENGKTFGSLIIVPTQLAQRLPGIVAALSAMQADPTLVSSDAIRQSSMYVSVTSLLASRYGCVVTNPPYMGGKYMNPLLKRLASELYPDSKSDLFAIFIERLLLFTRSAGHSAVMCPFVWMFLSSYERLRHKLVYDNTLATLIQPEYHAFFESAYVPICAFVSWRAASQHTGTFINLSEFYGEDVQPVRALEAIRDTHCGWRYIANRDDFAAIPGSPIAYWVSQAVRNAFSSNPSMKSIASPRAGLATGDNSRFQRYWHEVSLTNICFTAECTDATAAMPHCWYPCNSGGEFRKWYGNNETVVDWHRDGYAIRNFVDLDGHLRSRPQNTDFYFKPGVTWTKLSSSSFGARLSEPGFIFDDTGRSAFPRDDALIPALLGFLCSKAASFLLNILNPTMSYTSGDLGNLPLSGRMLSESDVCLAEEAVSIARSDWDSFETSWAFGGSPLLPVASESALEQSVVRWERQCVDRRRRLSDIEERNNAYFIQAFGLEADLKAGVADAEITLARPDRPSDTRRLLSYSVGCMIGRYSLDKPGLIYAHSRNEDFDASQYKTFPADPDGIIPVTEYDWFPDSATRRFEEFVGVAWPKDHLDVNLKFVADSLGPKNGEEPRDTIRRYFADEFFKDHLKTYKRRPIYWLFTSGKLGAFQCLVYLHRYDEGTLARMRTEYVIPLQGRISQRIDQLTDDITAATSTAHRRRLVKEQELLKKHQAELLKFDEKLRHYADQRIKLDLDDGVRENYGKFGDLLAEVKAVCGKKEDDE